MRIHLNILYSVVAVLLILQIASYISLNFQISKVLSDQQEMESELILSVGDVRREAQSNIDELVGIVARQNEAILQQRTDIEKELQLVKNTQADDFSGVIEDVIREVVSIRTDRSTGTGFLVDSSGYVVTNFHVIEDGQYVNVQTFDDRIYQAQLIGGDALTDLALLKIDGVFDSLELADSNDVNIGEKVIAIGNPLGLSFTVTEGIVSAVNRQGPNGLDSYIQTDVTLNPGNSGGPLINKAGDVIGINNFKIGGAESLGFALESDVVREVINSLASSTLIE